MKFYLIFLFLFMHETYSTVLPDYIPVCKTTVPDFKSCVLDSIEKMRPHLEKGIPELNIPPYDPFVIPKLTVNKHTNQLDTDGHLDNVKITGASQFKVNDLNVNLDTLEVNVNITLPNVHVSTDYELSSNLLMLPLVGKGHLEGDFTECSVVVSIQANTVKRSGTEYLQVEKLDTKLNIGNGNVKLNSGKERSHLARHMENFFNSHFQEVLKIIMPLIDDAVQKVVLRVVNGFLKIVPKEELLPSK